VGHFKVPAALRPIKSSGYPLSRRLHGPQRWSGLLRDEKHLLLLPGIEPRFLGYPVHTIVSIRLSGIYNHYIPSVNLYEISIRIFLQSEALQVRNLVYKYLLVILVSRPNFRLYRLL